MHLRAACWVALEGSVWWWHVSRASIRPTDENLCIHSCCSDFYYTGLPLPAACQPFHLSTLSQWAVTKSCFPEDDSYYLWSFAFPKILPKTDWRQSGSWSWILQFYTLTGHLQHEPCEVLKQHLWGWCWGCCNGCCSPAAASPEGCNVQSNPS